MTQWNAVSDVGLPPHAKRMLVCRKVADGNRYVDVMVYVPEPESGLPPLTNARDVTHWADLPEPPRDEAK